MPVRVMATLTTNCAVAVLESIFMNISAVQSRESTQTQNPNYALVTDTKLTRNAIGLLTGTALTTSVVIFILELLLFRDAQVLRASLPTALACFGLLLMWYGLSNSLRSLGWGAVVTFGLLWLSLPSRLPWLSGLIYLGVLWGAISVVRTARPSMRQIKNSVCLGTMAAALYLGCKWSYTSFDVLDQLRGGSLANDTLFHASIAAMLKHYGVISTGLNGLVAVPYHAFSHEIIAGISTLSGAGVLQVYGVAPALLFFPLFLTATVSVAVALKASEGDDIAFPWTVICLVCALAPRLFERWVFLDSYLVSESYALGLAFLGFSLPLLFKRSLHFADVVLIVLLATMSAYSKGSIGLILAGLWGVRMVMFGGFRRVPDALATLLVAGIVIVAVLSLVEANAPSTLSFLDFIRKYSFLGSVIDAAQFEWNTGGRPSWKQMAAVAVSLVSFLLFHFAFSWATAGIVARLRGWRMLLKEPTAVYPLASAFAGIVIACAVALPGASVFYFSNVAFFVALPVWTALLLRWLEDRQIIPTPFHPLVTKRALIASVGLLLLLAMDGAQRLAVRHQEAVQKPQNATIEALLKLKDAPDNVVMRLASSSHTENPVAICWAKPFVYPALSEHAWLDAIDPQSGCVYEYYGYAQYGMTATQSTVKVTGALPKGATIESWPQDAPPVR